MNSKKYIQTIVTVSLMFTSMTYANEQINSELVLPMDAINTIKNCAPQGEEIGIKLSTGNINESFEWMQKASQDLASNNTSGLKYLIKPRILYENHSNLMDIKLSYRERMCKEAVETVEISMQNFEWVITNKLNTPTEIQSFSDLYIVAVRKGVNVRDNPLKGTQAKIIDALQRGIGLRLVDKVKVNDIWWGRFVYMKNNQKNLGWIEMSNIRPTKSNKNHTTY